MLLEIAATFYWILAVQAGVLVLDRVAPALTQLRSNSHQKNRPAPGVSHG